MSNKAAGLIGLMEALAATDPVRTDMMGSYNPGRTHRRPVIVTRRQEEPKEKARRKQAAKSRKANRGKR